MNKAIEIRDNHLIVNLDEITGQTNFSIESEGKTVTVSIDVNIDTATQLNLRKFMSKKNERI